MLFLPQGTVGTEAPDNTKQESESSQALTEQTRQFFDNSWDILNTNLLI